MQTPMNPLNNDEEDEVELMDNDEINRHLSRLLEALKENGRNSTEERRTLNIKLEDLSRKQDNLPILLNDLERRQQTALDMMRREFEKMFVPRVEFDPKHQVILDKIREYDVIIKEGNTARDEYAKYKAMVNQHGDAIKDLEEHNEGGMSRLVAWLSVLIAIASFLFTFFQHISFHP